MDELAQIEEQLRQGLHHVSAPVGFTDRVMARVRPHKQVSRWSFQRVSQPLWLGVAAALLLAVSGGEVLHVHHQREAEMAAEEQLGRALQLTNHAMNEVETGVERSPAGRYAILWNGN